jgi:hypothetical protein
MDMVLLYPAHTLPNAILKQRASRRAALDGAAAREVGAAARAPAGTRRSTGLTSHHARDKDYVGVFFWVQKKILICGRSAAS